MIIIPKPLFKANQGQVLKQSFSSGLSNYIPEFFAQAHDLGVYSRMQLSITVEAFALPLFTVDAKIV